MTASTYILINSVQVFSFLHILAKFVILCLFDDSHSDRCEVVSYDFDLYFPNALESEKAMAPHSSTLAWKIPWMEEPGLKSMGSLRVGHD